MKSLMNIFLRFRQAQVCGSIHGMGDLQCACSFPMQDCVRPRFADETQMLTLAKPDNKQCLAQVPLQETDTM